MKPKHDKRLHQDISTDRTTSGPSHAGNKAPAAMSSSGVQGEGNYEAARVFNEAERKFVASGKVLWRVAAKVLPFWLLAPCCTRR